MFYQVFSCEIFTQVLPSQQLLHRLYSQHLSVEHLLSSHSFLFFFVVMIFQFNMFLLRVWHEKV